MTLDQDDTPDGPNDAPASPPPAPHRIFLVVVDESKEWRAALRYACRRVQHTGGHLALLHVLEPTEIQHWGAVEDVMREEQRDEAERLLQKVAREVNQLTGTLPILYVREGDRRDEMLKLIDEEPSLNILVLGANPAGDGPGPLIQYLTTKRIGQLRIPVTIVPGNLTPEEIDALA